MLSQQRMRILVVVAAGVIGGVVALVWLGRATGPSDGRAGAEAPGGPREGAIVVAAATGVRRSAGSAWVKARLGDALRVGDSIRTGAAGTAEIALGRGTAVTVAERSEVTVRELTAALQRVGVARGLIAVDLPTDGLRILRVEDRSGTIFASASGGRWHVVATPRGLGVAVDDGDVRVESAGAAVDVSAGSESAAWRGATPLPPASIPRDLSLRIAQVNENRRANACTVLQTDVASEVMVNGEPADVRADGSVTVRMPRARKGEVDVVVRHATGMVERKTIRCGPLP
jgi:hypothetical protein